MMNTERGKKRIYIGKEIYINKLRKLILFFVSHSAPPFSLPISLPLPLSLWINSFLCDVIFHHICNLKKHFKLISKMDFSSLPVNQFDSHNWQQVMNLGYCICFLIRLYFAPSSITHTHTHTHTHIYIYIYI